MQEVWRAENATRALKEIIHAAPMDINPHSEAAHMVRIAEKALKLDLIIMSEDDE